MTDIVRVTEEEFDDEGNLTRRTITEYGFEPPLKWKTEAESDLWKKAAGTFIGDFPNSQIVSYPNDGTYLVNNTFDHGSYRSHPVGGTDRNLHGEVVN